MKNIIISLCLGVLLFAFSFDYAKKEYPNEFYNVYLDDVLLGTITSVEQLDKYIETQTEIFVDAGSIVREFCPITEEAKELMEIYPYEEYDNCVKVTITDKQEIKEIYNPAGLYVEKIITYDNNTIEISDMYTKILENKNFSIKGYEFNVTTSDEIVKINVLDKEIFEEAIKKVIETYTGDEYYEIYLSDEKIEIKTTGKYLENVYVENDITFKETNIQSDEKIYADVNSLADYLLFGSNPKTSTYKVKSGEMIEDIAFANEISINEFLISNSKYKDKNALISEGTLVQIKVTDPLLMVTTEEFEVFDKTSEYQIVYQYNKDQYVNYEEVIQEGEDGLERISQKVKKTNGDIVFVEPVSKELLKPTLNKIIEKGEKEVPYIGDLDKWAWPTASGWTITTNYEWRVHPITGARDFHEALDIAGPGYNSPIYSVNNGKIVTMESHWSFGNYIVVNHYNGYYTLYAHLNSFMSGLSVGDTVAYGQQIGYMGSTGQSTGPHLHIEVWNCGSMSCRINPWVILD